jgi:RNA polymerase sigma-70 factor (ECF subfamily)
MESLIGVSLVNMKQLTAEELMLIYQNDHPDQAYEAFSEIYFRYNKRVIQFINKKVRSIEDCHDLLQKIFLKFHEKKHLYSPEYKCEQWLFVIARTQVIDFFRDQQKNSKRQKSIENQTRLNEDLISPPQDITPLFNQLSEDQKEFLEMKILDELSYQELSTLLNKSEVSLRKSFSRLIQKLKTGDLA